MESETSREYLGMNMETDIFHKTTANSKEIRQKGGCIKIVLLTFENHFLHKNLAKFLISFGNFL